LKAYEFALFLAFVSSLTGIICGYCNICTASPFPGVNGAAATSSTAIGVQTYTDGQANAMTQQSLSISSTSTESTQGLASGFTLWNAIGGILHISSILKSIIVIPNPHVPTENLFSPFADLIGLGCILTYAIGFYQAWTKVMLKYGY
jgi:hypothetical protein